MSETAAKEAFLAQLKEKNILPPSEHEMMRFLRARKLDVAAAVTQYVDCVAWRAATVSPDILGPDPNEPVYAAICPHANHKFDKQGRPIYIEKTGLIDLPKLLKHVNAETLVRRHVRQQEIAMQRMREESARRGTVVEKQLIILDLKGLSLLPNQTGISVFKECIRIDQNYYPETLGRFFIINAPWIFTPLWALIRPWLDPVTRDKFSVMGSNYREKLLELVDAESLPQEYGGTCCCEGGCVRPMVPLPGEERKK